MNHVRRFLLPSLLLGATLVLVIAFRSFFMAYFIRPVALMFWAAWRVMASVHQGVYWGILIFLSLTLAVRFLPPEGPLPPPAAYKYGRRRPGRVQYWLSLIRGRSAGGAQRDALREEIRDLLASVLARRGRSDPQDPTTLPGSELAALSAEARMFILPASDQFPEIPDKHKGTLSPRVWRLWSRLRNSRQGDEASISEILSWMESGMEISNDE